MQGVRMNELHGEKHANCHSCREKKLSVLSCDASYHEKNVFAFRFAVQDQNSGAFDIQEVFEFISFREQIAKMLIASVKGHTFHLTVEVKVRI